MRIWHREITEVVVAITLLCASTGLGISSGAERSVTTEAKIANMPPSMSKAEFYMHAESAARRVSRNRDEFWDWLRSNRVIREGLLVTLYPDFESDAADCLDSLRLEFGDKVDEYSHLALAFALVYGKTRGETIRKWTWMAKGRDVPSMSDSFRYYVTNENAMRFPLKATPWPLLVFVASNDVPVAEREWALKHYERREVSSLRKIHSDPKYVKGAGVLREAKSPSAPMALPCILQAGGVCSQKSYFQSSVLQALGVPAVRLLFPGHAYSGWVEPSPGLPFYTYPSLGRSHGRFFCPIRRQFAPQDELKMTASGVAKDFDSYMDTLVNCHIYAACLPSQRIVAARRIEQSLNRNPFCCKGWFTLAQASGDGSLPAEYADRLVGAAQLTLGDHPGILCSILETVMNDRLQSKTDSAKDVDRDVSTVRSTIKTIKRFEDAKRYDRFCMRMHNLMGTIVCHGKGLSAAVPLYSDALEYTTKAGQQELLLEHLISLAKDEPPSEDLRRLLEEEYERWPMFKKKAERDPRHATAGRILISYYRKIGCVAEAAALQLVEDQGLEVERLAMLDASRSGSREATVTTDVEQRVFGVTDEEVTGKGKVTVSVWQVLPQFVTASRYQVLVKHAAVGSEGAFHITAWADTDGDGLPDEQIGISPLCQADRVDQWSEWEFSTEEMAIFVGVANRKRVSIYYKMGGAVTGYVGLANRAYYCHSFGGVPRRSKWPRFTNIMVRPLTDGDD